VAAFPLVSHVTKGNGPGASLVEAGLALALFPSDPTPPAGMLRGLEGVARRSSFRSRCRLTRAMIDAKKPAEVRRSKSRIFLKRHAYERDPRVRALAEGRGHRLPAPTKRAPQYELSQRMEPTSPTGWYARIVWRSQTSSCASTRQAARDLSAVVSARADARRARRRAPAAGRRRPTMAAIT